MRVGRGDQGRRGVSDAIEKTRKLDGAPPAVPTDDDLKELSKKHAQTVERQNRNGCFPLLLLIIAGVLYFYPSGLEFPWWFIGFPVAFSIYFFGTGAHLSTHQSDAQIKLNNVKLLTQNSHIHLYLRSNSKLVTAAGQFEEFTPGSAQSGGHTRTKMLSIEAWLSRTLSETPDAEGVMVSLGDRNHVEVQDDYGARTLSIPTTDETWRDVVTALTDICYSILILPEQTPSLRYEMSVVASSALIDRCIVIMPPASDESAAARLREAWTEVSNVLRGAHDFALPPYKREGMLYLPNADYSVRAGHDLSSVPITAYGNIRDVDKKIKAFIAEHIDIDAQRYEQSSETLRSLMMAGHFSLDIE